MANSDAGTSSGSAGGGKYQVFLNFCGQDTRYGFTSFLYRDLVNNGIHAFMDDKEIGVGEEISRELLRAIDGSQIYVPIFSTNYASRKWCLLELVRIVDNLSKSKEKKILPIFFYVEPDDLKTKSYRKAIGDLKKEYEKKQQVMFPHEVESWKLESWEEAPKKVVERKCWVLGQRESQAIFVDKVVEEVLQELKIKYKSVTKDLVGLEHRVEEVLKLLDVDCKDQVRLLGIHGMGGIGKTTLAKIVYDGLYSRFGKYCAFLDDVQETSKKSLVSLQKKLLTAIGSSSAARSIHDVNNGRKKIGEIIGGEEVLVVLDDVGEEEQIKNLIGRQLHCGTRVIITTRNIKVLEFVDREMKETNSDRALQILTYEMEGMESCHAIELFKRHAFGEGSLAEDFDNLSVDIVNTTGGLPLALEVIGSLLYGKPKAKWESTLKQLRKVPHKDVHKALMISYKDLNYRQREIFLDIACFFINEDKTNANYMWEACGFDPNVEIYILVEMSLINIKDDKFWMHDQLRDLGREIVCQESPTILGRRSRLWTNEEDLDLVRTKLRKKKVEAIDLQGSSHIPINNEEIERFESLRFLRLSNGTLNGDFTDCLPMLKWISWSSPRRDCSVVNMNLKNLVVLEFFDNYFTDVSEVWDSLTMATKLKSLALVECHDITITPDLSKCLALERLTFDDCGGLTVIDSSIGMLTCLLDLDITHCGLVKCGPKIGNLASLRNLDLSCTQITSLPYSIGKLTALRTLDLSREPTEETTIEHIEETTYEWELPKAIGMLNKLEELYLGHRNELVGKIPDEIGDLSSLRVLDLCCTRICRVPETINKLSCLSTLDLRQCDEIKELPKLPMSLVCLRVESSSLEVVPDLSELTNLIELFLSNRFELHFRRWSDLGHTCDLGWIKRLSNLEILSDLTLHFSQMQEIQLDGLLQLQYLELVSRDLKSLRIPSSLRRLTILYCDNLIQFLGTSASLEVLIIEQCMSIGRMVLCNEVESLADPNQSEPSSSPMVLLNALKKLKKLRLKWCEKMPEIQVIDTLTSLQYIKIETCEAMEKLSGVSNLKNLESLYIDGCLKLRFVEGLDEVESLINLEVSTCPSLERLLDRSNSKIRDMCLIKVSGCSKSLDSSPKGYITFKSYKRMPQQGAPQPETNEEKAKMEGDAVEPDTEPQFPSHSSTSPSDHEISEEPPVDNVRDGTLPEKQNQMMEQDSNPLRLDELAPPRTFCDRFKTCLATILECVCNRDFLSVKAEIL